MQNTIRKALRTTLSYAVRPVLHPRVPISLQRRWLEVMASSQRLRPEVTITTITAGNVRAELAVPAGKPPRVILYLHGGGYCIGSPRTHRALSTALASYAEATVWTPAYRLAPEQPWPAAVDDAEFLYRHLLDRGFRAEQICLAGDSAGGGLAVSLLRRLQEKGGVLPGSLVLLSPMLDLRAERDRPVERDVLLSRKWVKSGADHYLGSIGDAALPFELDAFGEMKAPFPPTLIQYVEGELLQSDSKRMQAHLQANGTAVQVQVFQNLWHAFQVQAGTLAVADEALRGVAAFIRQSRPRNQNSSRVSA